MNDLPYNSPPDVVIERFETLARVNHYIGDPKLLTEEMRYVILARLSGETLEEAGARLGKSRERARQIQEHAFGIILRAWFIDDAADCCATYDEIRDPATPPWRRWFKPR